MWEAFQSLLLNEFLTCGTIFFHPIRKKRSQQKNEKSISIGGNTQTERED